MWHHQSILETACAGLMAAENDRTIGQSPYGTESLDEVELHKIMATSLERFGYGVLREQPYPAEWRSRRSGRGRRKPLPEGAERKRCDLVLTPRPGQKLTDELVDARESLARVGTLFEHTQPDAQASRADLGSEDAYWLEIKATGQFTYVDGVPGPNGSYASQLLRGVRTDLAKLRDDPSIFHAGVLLVLFCADEATARHDIHQVAARCIDRELLTTLPLVTGGSIPERINNRWLCLALFEPRRSAADDRFNT